MWNTKAFLVLAVILSTLVSCAQEKDTGNETTIYYFIRHAEKDRSDPKNNDPHLTEQGKKRAEKWAAVLKNIPFDAVYSTNYNRTLQTAKPVAAQNNIEITFYDPSEFDMNAFKKDTKGKKVLVVGHSNTTPRFVNLLSGTEKYEDIEDDNNANLYIVTLTGDKVTDMLLKID